MYLDRDVGRGAPYAIHCFDMRIEFYMNKKVCLNIGYFNAPPPRNNIDKKNKDFAWNPIDISLEYVTS